MLISAIYLLDRVVEMPMQFRRRANATAQQRYPIYGTNIVRELLWIKFKSPCANQS
jgi:hypothetical protein